MADREWHSFEDRLCKMGQAVPDVCFLKWLMWQHCCGKVPLLPCETYKFVLSFYMIWKAWADWLSVLVVRSLRHCPSQLERARRSPRRYENVCTCCTEWHIQNPYIHICGHLLLLYSWLWLKVAKFRTVKNKVLVNALSYMYFRRFSLLRQRLMTKSLQRYFFFSTFYGKTE